MTTTPASRSLRDTLRSNKFLYQAYGMLTLARLRLRAGLQRLDDNLNYRGEGRLPLPPPLLRFRVHGRTDRKDFLEVGERCSRDILAALATEGYALETFSSVLDFGCGCGRVLRHFLAKGVSATFTGTDIDAEGVAWCKGNYPGKVSWKVNQPMPPSPFGDGEFDFIYAISVFTHLDEQYQDAWLKELARITRPGGVLLLTVHGPNIYRTLAKEDQEIVAAKGFHFKVGRTGRLKLDGLPDFYQQAYHTPEYIQREWSKQFKVLRILQRGINDHQDAVLLRRE